jgi:Pyruvate/2-oxoacid:ferredoxin oxidoreductase delta subunit
MIWLSATATANEDKLVIEKIATASGRINAASDRGGCAARYEIDLDYCEGCGICAAECPCGRST